MRSPEGTLSALACFSFRLSDRSPPSWSRRALVAACSGRVADPSGAVLAGVKSDTTNEATGVSRQRQTNTSGDYNFLEVPPGHYRVEFEQTGFKKNVGKDVTIEVNQVLTLNMRCRWGAAKETVEVTSEAPLVETTSTQMGAVVNERAVIRSCRSMQRDTYSVACSCSQEFSHRPGLTCSTEATALESFRSTAGADDPTTSA